MDWIKRGCALAVVALLGACSMDKPVPDGYTGPTARVYDTYHVVSSTRIDFFYLSEVNGRRIPNSQTATRTANYGHGFSMAPVQVNREVPAEPSTFRICGRTEYAAPILALLNKVYEVSGETKFTPLPDHTYTVLGELADDHAAVWIEDSGTNQVVGQKIEINGSTTLGLFEK